MAVGIGSNIAALRAQRQLAGSSGNLSRIFERLSSGSRINRASDDAAGLAVSAGLNTSSRVFGQAVRNLNDGISALSIADQALSNLNSIVGRQRELAEQSANGVFSGTQRISLNREAQELASEYERLLQTTKFNGIGLLNGDTPELLLQGGFGIDALLRVGFLQQGGGVTSSTTNEPTSQLFLGSTYGLGDGSPAVDDLAEEQYLAVLDFNNDGYDDLLAVGVEPVSGDGFDYFITLFQGGSSGLTKVSDVSDRVESGGFVFDLVYASYSGGVLTIGANDFTTGFGDVVYDEWTIPSSGILPGSPNVWDNRFVPFGIGPFGEWGEGVVGDFNNDGVNDFATPSGTDAALKQIDVTLSNLVTTENDTRSIQDLSQNSIDLSDPANALLALEYLSTLQSDLLDVRARVGAAQSRVEAAIQVLGATKQQFEEAEGRILNADIAEESSALVRTNILQQTGAAVLAQANIQPQLALTLLRSSGI